MRGIISNDNGIHFLEATRASRWHPRWPARLLRRRMHSFSRGSQEEGCRPRNPDCYPDSRSRPCACSLCSLQPPRCLEEVHQKCSSGQMDPCAQEPAGLHAVGADGAAAWKQGKPHQVSRIFQNQRLLSTLPLCFSLGDVLALTPVSQSLERCSGQVYSVSIGLVYF